MLSRNDVRSGSRWAVRFGAALAALLLPLSMAQAGTSPEYRRDESRNEGGPNRCRSDAQCDGLRTCSPAGWCQGEARPAPRPPPPPPPPPSEEWGWGRGPRGHFEREPEMGRPVRIRSRLEGLVADVEGANPAKGTPIIAYPAKRWREGAANQVWELVPTRDGFSIRSRLNGLVLDIQGANRAPGARVITWEPTGADNQIWRLVPSSQPGYFYIQSKLNGFVLDIEGGRTDGQGHLIAYPRKGTESANQLWELTH